MPTTRPPVQRALRILRQAKELRVRLETDLGQQRFGSDDIRARTYNDLTRGAAETFPEDPVLNGEMIIMPDANIQMYGTWFGVSRMPSDLPTRRTLEHTERLINRLEFLLGEASQEDTEAPTASQALQRSERPEVQSVLAFLSDLKAGRVGPEDRDFGFVSDSELRDVLRQDYREVQLAYGSGAYKLASIGAGGLIEGLLLDGMQWPQVVGRGNYRTVTRLFPRRQGQINWGYVGLSDLISAARELDLLGPGTPQIAEAARNFRNTVHPLAEVRRRHRVEEEEAQLLLALVRLIYRDLERASQA